MPGGVLRRAEAPTLRVCGREAAVDAGLSHEGDAAMTLKESSLVVWNHGEARYIITARWEPGAGDEPAAPLEYYSVSPGQGIDLGMLGFRLEAPKTEERK
jgi:hypothetical protein